MRPGRGSLWPAGILAASARAMPRLEGSVGGFTWKAGSCRKEQTNDEESGRQDMKLPKLSERNRQLVDVEMFKVTLSMSKLLKHPSPNVSPAFYGEERPYCPQKAS